MNSRKSFALLILACLACANSYSAPLGFQTSDSSKTSSVSESPQQIEQYYQLRLFKPDSLSFARTTKETLSSQTIEIPFKVDSVELPIPLLSEPAQRYIDKLGDRDQAFPLTELLRQFVAAIKPDKKVRLDFIPSKVQIHALSTLWQRGKATQLELYAELDSTFQITMEELERELAMLEKKGIIDGKIISPRNELAIGMGPIPLPPVEMSPTNKRNRIYLYSPHLKKEQLSHYLQARFYEAQILHPKNSDFSNHLQHLYQMLHQSQ
jgi:predicted transcriptional regulator